MKKIPEFTMSFFWEYSPESISLEKDRDLVIGRLLSSGDWECTQWLRSKLSKDELRTWILHAKGRGLSPPRLRFWELLLDLPHSQVNRWLSEKGRKIWDGRTLS